MVAKIDMNRAAPRERLRRPDDSELALRHWPAVGRAVVLAHGFGQTSGAWTRSAETLSQAGFDCWSFDARGHGESSWRDAAPYRFEAMAEDLAAVARHAGARPVLVGASMGGLLGLTAQQRSGAPFGAMVLVDITPRWETGGVERVLAFMRAHGEGFASLAEARAAVAEYLPQRAGQPGSGRLRELLSERADGRFHWHWDPRLIDDLMPTAAVWQPQFAEALRQVRVPLLLVSGGASDVVSQSTIVEFMALAPRARRVVVPHAGHTVAGDDNHAFTRSVLEFLQSPEVKESSS